MARNAVDVIDGPLLPVRFALHDRDAKFCAPFRTVVQSSGVEPTRLPPLDPTLNAFAETLVRSMKGEFLSNLISLVNSGGSGRSKSICSIIIKNAIIKAKPVFCSSLPRTLHLQALGTTSSVSSA
jgi:hypothetical protein